MAAIRPASSDRSPVITRWIPALAPSARIRVITSVSAPPPASPSVVVKPSHRSSSTRTCGSRPLSRDGGALLGDPGEAAGGEQVLPPGQFGGQPGQQPGGAFVLGTGDHRAAVRQIGERQQRAVAAVDAVQVQVRAAEAGRGRGGEGAQQLGPPGPGRARRHQVPEGVQVDGRGLLPLEAGKIDQAERDGRVPRPRQPRWPGAARPARAGRGAAARAAAAPATGWADRQCPGRRPRGGSRRPGLSGR